MPYQPPERREVVNYDLYCLLVEWSWLIYMAPYEEGGKDRFAEIGQQLVDLRDEVLAGTKESDERMRLCCAHWICKCWKSQREGVLLTFLGDADPYVRCQAMDDGIVFHSEKIYEKLKTLIAEDPSPLVVSYATRHLSFFATNLNRREIVKILLSVLDRSFDLDWREAFGEEQHPHDAAMFALEDAMHSEFLGTVVDGVVARATSPRFDLVVANAREFLACSSDH